MKLKFNLDLVCDFYSGGYCGDGGYRLVRLVGKNSGLTVWSGMTCTCGRGCGNKDCVIDDWGYHDTDIEQYRAD